MQQKTHRTVQLEIAEPAREVLTAWIKASALGSDDWLFAGRSFAAHLSTRQCSRLVHYWIVDSASLLPRMERTFHQRTKSSLI